MFQLQDFMEEHGGTPQEWFAGIASNPEKKLFNHHRVDRKNGAWIYRLAASPDAAREVLDALVATGCETQPDPAEFEGTLVYVYLKSEQTRP